MGEKGKPLDKRGDTHQRDNAAIFVGTVIILLGSYVALAVWDADQISYGIGVFVMGLSLICTRLVQWIWNMVKPSE